MEITAGPDCDVRFEMRKRLLAMRTSASQRGGKPSIAGSRGSYTSPMRADIRGAYVRWSKGLVCNVPESSVQTGVIDARICSTMSTLSLACTWGRLIHETFWKAHGYSQHPNDSLATHVSN
jgi:hypothetical protein